MPADPAAQGAEERWHSCEECHAGTVPATDHPGAECGRCGGRIVAVVPLSRAQEAEAARDEKIAQAEHALAECYRLSGADPDGAQDTLLAPFAVHEVRRLRAECDELEDSDVALRARLEAVEAALRRASGELVNTAGYLSRAGEGKLKRPDARGAADRALAEGATARAALKGEES